MAQPRRNALLDLTRRIKAGDTCQLSDRELLGRFIAQRDEHAFKALVRRHGPMVLRVCQGILRQSEDAEDAFQATFLILARRAGSLSRRDSVGPWLRKTARRLALNARRASRRQQIREARVVQRSVQDPATIITAEELLAGLHDELARLPEHYRVPIMLCFLEGQSTGQAAKNLGCSASTLQRRLLKARELLRARLDHRGLSLSTAALGALFLHNKAAAGVPPMLAANTARAAGLVAAGKPLVSGIVSAHVLVLAHGASSVLFWTKLKVTLAVILVGSVIAGGGAVVGSGFRFSVFGVQSPVSQELELEPRIGNQAAKKTPVEAARPMRVDDFGDPLPEGAIARLGTVRFRPGGPGRIALAADCPIIVAAFGRTVSAWHTTTGKLIARYSVAKDLNALACSADGKILAVGGRNGIVRLLDLPSGREIRQMICHPVDRLAEIGVVQGVLFGPRDEWLVSWGNDGTIRRWATATGKELWRYDVGCLALGHVALSVDGNWLAASVWDSERDIEVREVRLLEVEAGKEVRRFPCPDVGGVAFSPDGKTLVAASHPKEPSDRKIIRWDVATGKELGSFLADNRCMDCPQFSPDGGTLVTLSDRMICVLDSASGRELRKIGPLDPEGGMQVVLARDGKTLASASHDSCRIRVWDFSTGRELFATKAPASWITAIAYSPTGRQLAVASAKAIHIHDLTAGMRELHECGNDKGTIRAVAFSADGKFLVSGSDPGQVRIWDVESGRETRRFQAAPRGGCLVLSPDGAMLAVQEGDDVIRLWDTGTATLLRQFPTLSEQADYLGNFGILLFSPDGKSLAGRSGSRRVLFRWDTATGKQLPSLGEHDECLTAVAWSPDGRTVATATRAGSVYLWETATGHVRRVVKDSGYTNTLAFSPDGRFLALDHNGDSDPCDDDNRPLHPNWDHRTSVRLLDLDKGKVVHAFTGHVGGIGCLAFSPDGTSLASGSADTTVLLWDVGQRSEVRGQKPEIRSLRSEIRSLSGGR